MTIRAYARPVAAILGFAGMAVLAWIAVTMLWGEPISAASAARAQAVLNRELNGVEGIAPPEPRRCRLFDSAPWSSGKACARAMRSGEFACRD